VYVSTCVCLDCAYTLPLHLRVPVTYFSIDDSRRSYCSAPCSWMMRCIDEIIHKSKLCFWKPWEKKPYFMAVEHREHDEPWFNLQEGNHPKLVPGWPLDDHWMIIGWLGREIIYPMDVYNDQIRTSNMIQISVGWLGNHLRIFIIWIIRCHLGRGLTIQHHFVPCNGM